VKKCEISVVTVELSVVLLSYGLSTCRRKVRLSHFSATVWTGLYGTTGNVLSCMQFKKWQLGQPHGTRDRSKK